MMVCSACGCDTVITDNKLRERREENATTGEIVKCLDIQHIETISTECSSCGNEEFVTEEEYDDYA